MDSLLSFDFIRRPIRRARRDKSLRLAASWPLIIATMLDSAVVFKDVLAEEGTAFQTFQIESAFYFSIYGAYFGGHLRSVPVSDSEGHRLIHSIREGTTVRVRYNPQNPDETHVLAEDNRGALPFSVWSV